jgi:tetratricopeptide (TPR) repeat protein
LVKSQSAFREADEIQKKLQPDFPLLYSFQGYQYCDMLLSQGNYAEVERRASQTLKLAKQFLGKGLGLHDIGNDNLSIGRSHFFRSQREPNHPFAVSITYLNLAVDGLRYAGQQMYLPPGLLARAAYYRVTGDLDKAGKDLDEAFTIASRGGMGLNLADCHLEYARLALARGEKEKAREHWQIARESIEEMGYHRRDKEVEELEKALLS